ncbi:hypothetical protein Glaag_2474 [Glaciecola sp. 4H-3-7+YE-5]|jgi:hypothetical protein|nr:hypothetical protein Glaag_2474 [Glaciecola sp. 4H-3-7+YE-5]
MFWTIFLTTIVIIALILVLGTLIANFLSKAK